MKSFTLVVTAIALFITLAAAFLVLFEYREDNAGGSGWYYRHGHQQQMKS